MSQEGVLAVLVIDYHVVAQRWLGDELTGCAVGLAVHRRHHRAGSRRQDGLPEAVVGLVAGAADLATRTVPNDEEIVGETLVGVGGVVVLVDAAATPPYEPLAFEGQPQLGPRLVVEVGGGRLLRFGGGADEHA